MANDTEMITTKTVVDLDEKTTPVDMDLFVIGNAGTATLKKLKWSSMLAAIKTKIAEWTFQTLNTSDKTIPGALNELNNKFVFETVYSGGEEIEGSSSKEFRVEDYYAIPDGYEIILSNWFFGGSGHASLNYIPRGVSKYIANNNSTTAKTINATITIMLKRK